jgi:hypothetical protein
MVRRLVQESNMLVEYLIRHCVWNTLDKMNLPLHQHQRESHDCGVASVAMAANIAYEDAKKAFDALGLHVKKHGRQPYSSNFKNVQEALCHLGCRTKMKRFHSWGDIKGPTIVKVENGHPRNWHWVYATKDPTWGLVILDPGLPDPHMQHPLPDVIYVPLDYFKPKGNMLVIERPKNTRLNMLSRLQTILISLPKRSNSFPLPTAV